MFLLFQLFAVVESAVSALAGAHTVRFAHGQRTASAAVARLTPVPLKRRGWLVSALRAWPIGHVLGQRHRWHARAPPSGDPKFCIGGSVRCRRRHACQIPEVKPKPSANGEGTLSMVEHKRFDARLNIYVSAELQRKLEQIRDQRGPKVTVPDIVREAVRMYIDNEEEVIGSRRHFQRNLRDSIGAAKDELLWNNLVMLAFLWQLQSPVTSATTKQKISFKETYDNSISFATKSWEPFLKQLQDAMEQSLVGLPVKDKS